MRSAMVLIAFACALTRGLAFAADLRVLSAGAVEPALVRAIAAFQHATGQGVQVTFNTSPQLKKRLDDCASPCASWDVVIAPPSALDDLAKAGKVDSAVQLLGRVGLGIAVRDGAPVPDIATVEALQQALEAASAIVFNRASTGLYFESWLRKAGLYDKLAPRAVRFDDGASIMERLIKSSGNEIGVGAITEILLYRDKGVRYVGPLPAAIQNYTPYAAAAVAGNRAGAQVFVQYLGSADGQQFFRAAGIQ